MKYVKTSIILGVSFGVALFPVAYLNLVLGIALAFVGNTWFAYMTYIFAGLGITTIIGACFAKRNAIVTRVVLTVSTLVMLIIMIYLMAQGILFSNILLFILYLIVLIIGVLATIFAYIIKKENLEIQQNKE